MRTRKASRYRPTLTATATARLASRKPAVWLPRLPSPVSRGGGGQPDRKDQQQSQAAHLAGPKARPILAGDVPQLGHGMLAGLGDAAGTPQQPGDPDGQAKAVGPQGVDVVFQLGAEDGELGQGRVQHLLF